MCVCVCARVIRKWQQQQLETPLFFSWDHSPSTGVFLMYPTPLFFFYIHCVYYRIE
jgi:hypothetical protein